MAEYLSQKPSVGLGASSPPLQLHTKFEDQEESQIKTELEASSRQLDEGDTANIQSPYNDISQKLNALNIHNAVTVANEALTEIVKIREKQLALTKTVKDGPEDTSSTNRDNLNSELTALQTEITRISDNATFNGQNMIQGGFQGLIDIDSLDISNKVISYGDFTSQLGNLGASLSSVTNASTSYDTISANITSLRIAQNDVEIALDETTSVLNQMTGKRTSQQFQDYNKILDEKEAEKLAKSIAQDLQNFTSNNPLQGSSGKLVEFASIRLDNDRVARLTSDY